MRCWASNYCKKKGDGCSEFCLGYVMLEALYSQSEMPRKYQYPQKLTIEKADAAAYKQVKAFMDEITEKVDDGEGLYLYGTRTGTGKTSLACSVMNAYFRKTVFQSNLECMGMFVHVPSFLEAYRKAYGDEENATQWAEKLHRIWNAKLVIFDDIGAEKPSEWVRERLLTLLDYRVGAGLSNIFTSNMPVKSLSSSELLGARIASRIQGCSTQIELVGADKRGVELNG